MQLNLIDIGAHGGLEFPWRRNPGIIGTTLSFEPNDEPRDEPGRMVRDCAIWNYDGEAEFTVYGEHGFGSSLLKQNVDWVRENFDWLKSRGNPRLANTWLDRATPKGTFTCRVRKLDTVLAEMPDRPRFHFLKSDTQSGEWFVLDGARDFIANECLGVEFELFRYPLYEGLRTDEEVRDLMADLGFSECGSTPWQNSFESQCDVLFIKRDVAEADRGVVEAIRGLYGVDRGNRWIKQASIGERILHKLKMKVAA